MSRKSDPKNPAPEKLDPLANELVERHRLPPEAARRAVETVFDVVRAQLVAGNQVSVKDFGALKLVERTARIVKDPETGHQFIAPAENAVDFAPDGAFAKEIAKAKLSAILLVVPAHDSFARVIEFHFSRTGWKVIVVDSAERALAAVRAGGVNLGIIDHGLDGGRRLIEELRLDPGTARVPIIGLYPASADPARTRDFQVLPDERLVEPFEVYALLMLAESELARSSEEELLFDHQLRFQCGTTLENVERAIDLGSRAISASSMHPDHQELFKAAYREAIGNAAQHGNGDDPTKLIGVQYYLDREKATIVVEDDGPGFDHARMRERAETKDAVSAARERHSEGRGGGLGIMLIQKCVDRVEYSAKGNAITISKRLRPPAG